MIGVPLPPPSGMPFSDGSSGNSQSAETEPDKALLYVCASSSTGRVLHDQNKTSKVFCVLTLKYLGQALMLLH